MERTPASDALRARRRKETLVQCQQAEQAWAQNPGRNLVLFFDGTGNILGNSHDTNVVKLMKMLDKRRPYQDAYEQMAYYDPGVGSNNEFPPAGFGARTWALWRKLMGLALGQGAFLNVAEGYEFLCREYRPGDRIWLFGFSRGAFTARAVGGMVNMYGLVYPSTLTVVPTLVRTYFAKSGRGGDSPYAGSLDSRDQFATDVIEHFALGRTPLVHFTGVWDTVETIGITGGVAITNSTEFEHKRFVHVRHALALHETRHKYRPREYTPPDFTAEESEHRSFQQYWFRGVHSDIGGSYVEDGLSNITLNWMAEEAERCGLEFVQTSPTTKGDPHAPMHDQVLDSPYWLLTGLNARERNKRSASVHPSAMPVENAAPARRSQMSWVFAHLGTVLFMAFVVLLAIMLKSGAAACLSGEGASLFARLPFASRLLELEELLTTACNVPELRKAAGLYVGLLLALWLWLPYPLAWAMRRRAAPAIAAGHDLPALFRFSSRGLWAMLIAGTLATVLGICMAGRALAEEIAAVALVVQFACLLWMLAVILAGASTTHPSSRSP